MNVVRDASDFGSGDSSSTVGTSGAASVCLSACTVQRSQHSLLTLLLECLGLLVDTLHGNQLRECVSGELPSVLQALLSSYNHFNASAFANCCAICSLRKANCRLRSCPTGKEMRFKMKRAQKLSPPPPLHKFRQPVRLPVRLPAHPPPTHFPSVSPSIRPPTNFPSVIFSVRRCTHACTRTGDHHQRICCYSGALENSHL